MTADAMPRAKFHHMKDGTAEDWMIIGQEAQAFAASLHQRLIDHLMLLKDDCGGFPVDRLTHCLQTATLAHKDGKDEEYVICALLHDIGDTLGPANHADIAATILEPYVSEENHWMVKHHAIFQGYYFFEYLGLDRNLRDQYRDHPYYARTLEFIEKYDAPAFDPEAETYSLDFF
jgi:predicted HD phosphohydrolase